MPREVLEQMAPRPGAVLVDGTVGMGGHAEILLEAMGPAGMLLGIDRDGEALGLAGQRLARFGAQVRLVRAGFGQLAAILQQEGLASVDGVLLDLGVSSLQLDAPRRGFSFLAEGPLDMRMDDRLPRSAADLLRDLSAEDLADIFYRFGEERQARRIAARVVERRKQQALATTKELAELVAAAIPRRFHPPRIHVATRVFQALRIAVNGELAELARLLADAPALLAPGGKLCVLTFHSLEDRMVKQALAGNPAWEVVTKKPVVATIEEVASNPRARSAKLRVGMRKNA
ncbi:MAG: 16S rRNA (cytosine(1402)-N(4))-methyltransferase [Desulfobulbaceae bacterium A2]|nr:MAG: 16S rRNA (cytosine(1402)-N(4))-methyltransferase [Desulfobulbaceae bacterium A2]